MVIINDLYLGGYYLDRYDNIIICDVIEYLQQEYDCKFGEKIIYEDGDIDYKYEYSTKAEPIILTEELLRKFGFGQNIPKTAWWIPSDDLFLVGQENDEFYFSFFSGSSDEPTIEHIYQLKYVHQLQNQFFLMMKKPLKFT